MTTDRRIAIWNLLHDAEITAASNEGTEPLTLFLSIPFLRRRIAPLGDSLVLSLSGVTLVEFRHFDGEVLSLAETLAWSAPEVLSTGSDSLPVVVETTAGQLVLAFEAITFSLDTGQSVDFEMIERVCREYWAEWRARSQGADRK